MNDYMKTILRGIKTSFYLKSESDARYFKKEDAEKLIEDSVEELLGDFNPDTSPINADTLGGILAENYATKKYIESLLGGIENGSY